MSQIHSTLTASQTTARRWDVIIIGAGPAGSAAANQLARAGCDVLLVDRVNLPRDKVCGGCLNGRAIQLLDRLGIDSESLFDAGAISIRRFQMHVAGKQFTAPLHNEIAIDRSTLDAMCVRQAVHAGASLLTGCSAEVLDRARGHRYVAIRSGDGVKTCRASIVIAADGLQGRSLKRISSARRCMAPNTHLGMSASVWAREHGLGQDSISMFLTRSGYIGAVHHGDNRLHLAAAVDPSALRTAGSPAQLAAKMLDSSGHCNINAICSARWKAVGVLTHRRHHIADHRLFIIGDAAGYVEPLTGEGIAWALQDGIDVAPIAARASRTWINELAVHWTRHRQRSARARQRRCRVITSLIRHPTLVHPMTAIMGRSPVFSKLVLRMLNPAARPRLQCREANGRISCPP